MTYKSPLVGVTDKQQATLSKRCFVAVFACLIGLVTTAAQALSLGDVEVQSKLNEPLVAQIEVVSATASEIGSLQVGLAGEEDWQRAGLQAQGAAANIRFGFVATGNGNLAITLRTERAVREPLLVFLVDAAWNSGHLLREYTVFLDPASLPINQAPPVVAPVLSRSTPQFQAQTSAPAAAPLGGSYGPVKRGQSLSLIAERLIAGTDLKRDQMVWALFQLNEAAFTNSNINLLNVGAELQLPSYDEAAAVSPEAARRLVSRAVSAATPRAEPRAEAAPLADSRPATLETGLEQKRAPEVLQDVEAGSAPSGEADAAASNDNASNEGVAAAQPAAVDKLELLPLEENNESDSAGSSAQRVDRGLNGAATANRPSAADGAADSAAAGSDSGQRERELTAENALLRERINETEALLKEIRALLAARSEQLADLQQRLETVESRSANGAETAGNQSSQPIGWFWWLLLVLGLLILLLLVLLLLMLTRREKSSATASALPTRFESEEKAAETTGTLDQIAEPPPTAEKPQKAIEPVFSSAPPIAPSDEKVAADESSVETVSAASTAHEAPADKPEQTVTDKADVVDQDDVVRQEVVEQREVVDDTPLEFDVGSYVAAGHTAGSDHSSADEEELAALPEIASGEDEAVDELVESNETPASEAEPEFDVVPGTDDVEPLELPELDSDVAGLELETELPEPEPEPEPGLGPAPAPEAEIEPDAEPALQVAEEDIETIELDAGLSPSGEALTDDEEGVPAIDNAVDVSDFSGGDQVATKLDLARVYADMGDGDEARSILSEVLRDGDESQQQEAQAIIDSLG